jgi:hypothetical protein
MFVDKLVSVKMLTDRISMARGTAFSVQVIEASQAGIGWSPQEGPVVSWSDISVCSSGDDLWPEPVRI